MSISDQELKDLFEKAMEQSGNLSAWGIVAKEVAKTLPEPELMKVVDDYRELCVTMGRLRRQEMEAIKDFTARTLQAFRQALKSTPTKEQ